MQYKSLIVFSALALSTVVFAGCKPKPTAQNPGPFSPTPTALPEVQAVETIEVQKNICGALPSEVVTQLTGIKVGPPSVTTISTTTGAKRHICSYAKDGDLSAEVLHVNVSYKKENSAENFQQLWEAQKGDSEAVQGLGTEAFTKKVDNQPVLYVLAPEAQYWLKMGKLDQSETAQKEMLRRVADSILSK